MTSMTPLERAVIVAWLKREGQRPIIPGSIRGPEALLMAADAIDRGDHLGNIP